MKVYSCKFAPSFVKQVFLKIGKVLKNIDCLGENRPFAKVQNPNAAPPPCCCCCCCCMRRRGALSCMCACAWRPFVRPFLTCARIASPLRGIIGWLLARLEFEQDRQGPILLLFLPSNGHHDQKRGELLLLLNARPWSSYGTCPLCSFQAFTTAMTWI